MTRTPGMPLAQRGLTKEEVERFCEQAKQCLFIISMGAQLGDYEGAEHGSKRLDALVDGLLRPDEGKVAA